MHREDRDDWPDAAGLRAAVNRGSSSSVEPFTIDVSAEVLADLRQRWSAPAGPMWLRVAGGSVAPTRTCWGWLLGYWLREFDWSARQAELNAFPQFRATVDGLGLHFVHQRGGDAVPLLVLHGWPSTFAQMTRLVPLLTHSPDGDPAGLVFDVVVPSLPGFGFSDRLTTPGWNLDAMVRVLHRLMVETLGYRRYAVRGSDYGLSIALRLGALYPQQVIGVHVGGTHLRVDRVPDDLSAAEERFVAASRRWYAEEGGYVDIQSTKPQTLGYALTDSPVGLLGWIVEKYRTWCARPEDLLSVFSADDLLTVATMYWATGTITSSMRLYQEERLHPLPADPVRVARDQSARQRGVSDPARVVAPTPAGQPTHLADRCQSLSGMGSTRRALTRPAGVPPTAPLTFIAVVDPTAVAVPVVDPLPVWPCFARSTVGRVGKRQSGSASVLTMGRRSWPSS